MELSNSVKMRMMKNKMVNGIKNEWKYNKFGCILWLIIVISSIACIPKFTTKISTEKYGTGNYTKYEIIATAKHHVKQQLKSPSSAKFCPQNEISIYESNNGINVSGYVNADNSFGVSLKKYFTVVLTKDGGYVQDVYIH